MQAQSFATIFYLRIHIAKIAAMLLAALVPINYFCRTNFTTDEEPLTITLVLHSNLQQRVTRAIHKRYQHPGKLEPAPAGHRYTTIPF